jgi:hypothetical protein
MGLRVTTPAPSPAPANHREWTPHIWEGCDFLAWVRLLARNRFAVHWSKWYVVAVVTVVSVFHTLLRILQTAVYGRVIARTRIIQAPVFIIGHWRTGTTLLHELLIRDPNHAFATTYECLAPNHFLLTGRWLPRWLWWMMPSHRPMDNMAVGWDRPQEDEFALCILGLPSPYDRIAFPNRTAADGGSLDLLGLSLRQRQRWKATFLRLMRELTYAHGGKRLILKSPPHTARISTLLELFPDARFIHIVRDPYVVYPSTLNLWRSLYEAQGLQRPTFAGLEEYVLRTFEQMFDGLEKTRKQVAGGRFYEIRYEDLVRDPLGQLRAMYHALDLGDFAAAQPRIEEYLAGLRRYETNRYELSAAETETVTRRWGAVIRRYGYPVRT